MKDFEERLQLKTPLVGFDLVLTIYKSKTDQRGSFRYISPSWFHLDTPHCPPGSFINSTRAIDVVNNKLRDRLQLLKDDDNTYIHFTLTATPETPSGTWKDKFIFQNIITDLYLIKLHKVDFWLYHLNVTVSGYDISNALKLSSSQHPLFPFFGERNDVYYKCVTSSSDLEVDDIKHTFLNQPCFEDSDSDSDSDSDDDIPLVSFAVSVEEEAAFRGAFENSPILLNQQANSKPPVWSVLPRGVSNTHPGNKCYFISVMQAIAHCAMFPVLANHICFGSAICLAKLCYNDVLISLHSNCNKAIQLTQAFWTSFEKLVPEIMRNNNQQDAEEMFMAICVSLNDCESRKSNVEPTQLQQLLQITYSPRNYCENGCRFEKKNEIADILSVVIIGTASNIQKMINDYFRIERLTPENPHLCHCEHNWKTISHFRSLEPKSLGKLLVVHLRRYKYIQSTNCFERISADIDISDRISIKEVQYRVCAIVCHSTYGAQKI